jgi:hypothetical protein
MKAALGLMNAGLLKIDCYCRNTHMCQKCPDFNYVFSSVLTNSVASPKIFFAIAFTYFK